MQKIPLYKLFLIVAVYAVPLAVFSSHGPVAIFVAILASTAASGAVILMRSENFRAVWIVGLSSICGAFAGCLCLPHLVLFFVFGGSYGFREHSWVVSAAIGAFVGGLLGSLCVEK